MFLTDAPRKGRTQAVVNEALRAAIKSNSSQTCGELSACFQVSVEMIRLHLHHLEKACRLSKWIPHTLSNTNMRRFVTPGCHFLLSTAIYPYLIEHSSAVQSTSSMICLSLPDIDCHHGSMRITLTDLLSIHARTCFVYG